MKISKLQSIIIGAISIMLLPQSGLAQGFNDYGDATTNYSDYSDIYQLYGGGQDAYGQLPIDDDTDYLTTQEFVNQGNKLARYGAYVSQLAEYGRTRGAPDIIVSQIEQNAALIETNSQSLVNASQYRITSDQATLLISQAVLAMGSSLQALGEGLVGIDKKEHTDAIYQIGRTMVKAAENLRGLSIEAQTNGGNLDLDEYQRQQNAIEYLLIATRFLDSSIRTNNVVNAVIESSVSAERGTTYQLISFNAINSSDPLGTIERDTGYFWDFGDGEFATGAFVTHLFDQANSYVVHLYVLGPSGFGMQKTVIKVKPVMPVAVISTDQEPLVGPHDDFLKIFQGQNVMFSGKNSFNPADPNSKFTYHWDFGDGSTDDVQSDTVYHSFSEPREYKVILMVTTPEGQSQTALKVVRVLPTPPEAKFSVISEQDGVESGPDKDFYINHANGKTSLTFNARDSRGAPVEEDGNLTRLVEAIWDFGDGTSVVSQNEADLGAELGVSHSYESAGRYVAKLTLKDELGSVSSRSKIIQLINPNNPTADFSWDISNEITTHREVTFDSSDSRSAFSTIVNKQWELRLVKQDSLRSEYGSTFRAKFDQPGKYEVSLITKDANGNESPEVVQQISVLSTTPQPAFVFSRAEGEPNVFLFDASSSRDPDDGDTISYSWDFNSDGNYEQVKRSKPTASYLFDKVGSQTVTLRVTDRFNRSAYISKEVIIDATLVARIQPDVNTPTAGPSPLQVNILGAAYLNLSSGHDVNNVHSLTFSFGDGTSQTIETQDGTGRVTHTFENNSLNPKTYTVTMTAKDAFGNKRRTSMPVVVGRAGEVIPIIDIKPELPELGTTETEYSFSALNSVSAKGLNSGLQANWDFGDGSSLGEGMAVKHSYNKPGLYEVTLTITDNQSGKLGRISRTVEVVREPSSAAFFAGPTEGRAPLTVTFDGTASNNPNGVINSYIWSFGDTAVIQQSVPTITHEYKEPGNYSAKLIIIDDTGSKVEADPVTINVR